MFMQVIHGHVTDPEQAHEALDSWVRDLAPGAQGWLGTTAGVTEEGHAIVLARFDSQAAARRNSDRHEQEQWWTALSKNFTGEASFFDSDEVVVEMNGEPDTATFVQVMQGRVSDSARARSLMEKDLSGEWETFRPEVLGTVNASRPDGTYFMAIYFTSESAAREGERKQAPPAIAELMKEMNSLNVEEPTFYDLRRPWIYSAR